MSRNTKKHLAIISLCAAIAGVLIPIPMTVLFAVFASLSGVDQPYFMCFVFVVGLETVALVAGLMSRQNLYGKAGLSIAAISLALTAILAPALFAFRSGQTDRLPNDTPYKEPNEPNTPEPGHTITNSIDMNLICIPPGRFTMGSPPTEAATDYDERPRHLVAISKPFYMSVTEVTQAQWQAVMTENQSSFKGDDRPVETISWEQADEFCKELTRREGKKYRLPTEAEWEYACRAGSTTTFSFGDSDANLPEYAWFASNSALTTHPVGTKKPNKFGLHDMHGNVWEWCGDWYDADYYAASPDTDPQGPATGEFRVLRGGSRTHYAPYCRSANRRFVSPVVSSSIDGFRIVLELEK